MTEVAASRQGDNKCSQQRHVAKEQFTSAAALGTKQHLQ
jgi:hypothetical protein